MKISIVTLFPEVFTPLLNSSMLFKAQKNKLVEFEIINLRDFGHGNRKQVDDRIYGGGVGMLLKPDVLSEAVTYINKSSAVKAFTVLTSASGKTYNQSLAKKLSKKRHVIIVCGHYEGVDERFTQKYVDLEISIGDYVLTGGEIPTMVITDSIVRLLKGVLDKEAVENESFEKGLLEHPQYTRPEVFEGSRVPSVLLSGDHKKIENWRNEQALKKTKKNRPELIKEPI